MTRYQEDMQQEWRFFASRRQGERNCWKSAQLASVTPRVRSKGKKDEWRLWGWITWQQFRQRSTYQDSVKMSNPMWRSEEGEKDAPMTELGGLRITFITGNSLSSYVQPDDVLFYNAKQIGFVLFDGWNRFINALLLRVVNQTKKNWWKRLQSSKLLKN